MNKENLTFECVECTQTKNGDYHIKLQYIGDIAANDDFGTTTKKSQLTFYRFVDNPVAIGKKGKIDFAKFKVRERDYDTGEEIVTLKYLEPLT